jgi:hypothetical protein
MLIGLSNFLLDRCDREGIMRQRLFLRHMGRRKGNQDQSTTDTACRVVVIG